MRSNILFTLPFLVAIMTAISIVQANPVPTAAPVILKARQDGGPSTTAAITSTIQPGAGITGNGCNEVGNVAICCPEGYQAETNNNVSTCVKGDGGATFNGSGDDSGSGENDGGDSTESVNDGTTITGDSGTIIVGGGSNGSIGGETIGGSTSTASSSSSTSSSTSPTTTTSSSSSSTHNDVGKLSVPYTFAAAAMVGAAMIAIV